MEEKNDKYGNYDPSSSNKSTILIVVTSLKISKLALTLNPIGLVGLKNIGNTCFM